MTTSSPSDVSLPAVKECRTLTPAAPADDVALSASMASPFPLPPNAASILLQCMETQRQLRAAAIAREHLVAQEDKVKGWRLTLLRRQQQRREEQNRIDNEVIERTAAMLEELVAAVRDREMNLLPDGYQTFVFPNEDIYEGNWKGCRMHGKGCLRIAETRDIYEGQWFLGQRCGPGIFRSATFETLYSGAWLDNKRHGRGELLEPEGVYSGEFIDNRISGFGEYVFNDGHVYRGDWRDGLFHGSGTYLYPSGSKYEGSWRLGCEHGRGTRTFANGDVLSGTWHEGLPHGPGAYTSAEFTAASNRRSGVYVGSRHRRPRSSLPSRESGSAAAQRAFHFEGEWVHGSISGSGTCVFADGAAYSGEWQNGVPHGQGIVQFPPAPHPREGEADLGFQRQVLDLAGCCYAGQFQKGRRCGYGVFTGPLAQYTGEWREDRKEGCGTIKACGIGTYEGGWHRDAPDGVGTYTADNEPLDHPFIAAASVQQQRQEQQLREEKVEAKHLVLSNSDGDAGLTDVKDTAEGGNANTENRNQLAQPAPAEEQRPLSEKGSGALARVRPTYRIEFDKGLCIALVEEERAMEKEEREVAETGLNLRLEKDAL